MGAGLSAVHFQGQREEVIWCLLSCSLQIIARIALLLPKVTVNVAAEDSGSSRTALIGTLRDVLEGKEHMFLIICKGRIKRH